MSIVANIYMLIFGLSLTKKFAYVMAILRSILMPIIVLLCVIGSYAIEDNMFHILAVVVLGIILGPIIDQNFLRALVLSEGNIMSAILNRPISIVLFIFIAGLILIEIPMVRLAWSKMRSGLFKKYSE